MIQRFEASKAPYWAIGLAVVAFWVISRRKAVALPPRARVHQRTMGEAIKIDEYVPTATPIMMAREKSRSTAPPNRNRQRIGMSVTVLVRMVRLSVLLMLEFMICSIVPGRPLAKPAEEVELQWRQCDQSRQIGLCR